MDDNDKGRDLESQRCCPHSTQLTTAKGGIGAVGPKGYDGS